MVGRCCGRCGRDGRGHGRERGWRRVESAMRLLDCQVLDGDKEQGRGGSLFSHREIIGESSGLDMTDL